MLKIIQPILDSFKNPEQSWLSFVIEMVILLAVVLFIRFYVFQFFQVSGPSMCPTLNELNEKCTNGKGEFVFVNQAIYNFFRDPVRGEIVVFRPPNGKKEYYIKRVIGVPGDTVSINDGKVYLSNDEVTDLELDEPYLSSRNQGRTRTSLNTFTVPEDSYLLFGDNRSKSLDARRCYSTGCSKINTPYVKSSAIKGTAEFVIWPFWTTRWLQNPFQ